MLKKNILMILDLCSGHFKGMIVNHIEDKINVFSVFK